MAKLRRPHVVPAGYQRNFADGERIKVVDKATKTERCIGVRDNFVSSHLLRVIKNGVANDHAEDTFAKIESVNLPLIRSLRPFAVRGVEVEGAVKVSMAVLWARSFAREVVAGRIHEEVRAEMRVSVLTDESAMAVFRHQYGREPEQGDLEVIVDEVAAALAKSRVQDVGAMLRHQDEALRKFAPLHISVYEPATGCEFVTSDNPVLLARANDLVHVGAQNGLALGDASFIFVPISPTVGACLTMQDEGDLALDRATTVRLNQAMWRNAMHRIACHPRADWRMLCNVQS